MVDGGFDPRIHPLMATKNFSLGALLNMAQGILLTSMDDIYELANHMTGDSLYTHQLPRAFEVLAPELRRQFPWLASPEFEAQLKKLREALDTTTDKPLRGDICAAWLAELRPIYGDSFDIAPIDNWEHIDPVVEMEQKLGSTKDVIVVETPSQ